MDVARVRQFLMSQRRGGPTGAQFIERFSETLVEAGLPLWRVSTTLLSFDPTVIGPHVSWVRDEGLTVVLRPYTILSEPTFTNSPVNYVIETGKEFRTRLDIPTADLPYAMLGELQEKGATDFFIVPIRIGDALTSASFSELKHAASTWMSFTTDDPRGFAEEDLDGLRSVMGELALRLALETTKESTKSLLRAYLGPNAARRVLDGSFRRGTAEMVRSVIWFCDMRGFTVLSDASTPEQVVRALDDYFDCVAKPIEARGGEVLKFIGDAVLAIFPYEQDTVRSACDRAMVAAKEAIENLKALPARPGVPTIGCGVALHIGDVYYGNIGTPSRLDFTVIGAAVNEACRVEALTRPLNVDVLMTEAFVRVAAPEKVRTLGRHQLKGVSGTHEVFTFA